MNKKIQQLILAAEKRMTDSYDILHDVNHVKRVVHHTKEISHTLPLNQEQKQALILAAWWHDAGRTIIRKPSIVWMRVFDDLISALLLWRETLRIGIFGSVVGLATRIILCKSFGAGRLFTHIILRKKNRILVNILADADALDIFHIERVMSMCALADQSKRFHYGYRLTIWWFLHTSELKFRTETAQKYFHQVFEIFLAWLNETPVRKWHYEQFGNEWVEKKISQAKIILEKMNSESQLMLS